MKPNNDIIIVGSVAFDSIRTPFGERESILGGSATYSAVSASKFTKSINLVACVGKDFPQKYISLFKSHGINTDGIEISDKELTFRWKGDYSYDLNAPKTIYTHLNAFGTFKPKLPAHCRSSRFVFLANIDPDLQDDVLSQTGNAEFVLCDTMNYWIGKKRKSLLKLLKKVDIFLLNESEARDLTGEANLKKAAKFILSSGAPYVIIKKGEHGVLFFAHDFLFACPAYMLEEIRDPTGAGDTFAGGFLGYLSRTKKITKKTLKQAVVYGSIMASFSVEDFGPKRLFKINRRDIAKRYNEFRRITAF